MLEFAPIKALSHDIMLPFLKWSYSIIPNYGIAIILLTTLIKVLFIPLMAKQYKSMKGMQKIQPQVQKIKDKFKADPKQAQIELMGLYKENGVNPFQGCLPMLFQVPFFIAVYSSIASPEFKALLAQPGVFAGLFPFWLKDLSIPDHTYILPVALGFLTYYTQKMMTVDPMQKKFLLFTSVIMVVFGLKLPSGVVLYWTVSTSLSAAQQLIMLKPEKQGNVEVIPKEAS